MERHDTLRQRFGPAFGQYLSRLQPTVRRDPEWLPVVGGACYVGAIVASIVAAVAVAVWL